ncbi:MAG: GNAT family N-acetyltransferase [Pseudomonadota bacterium]
MPDWIIRPATCDDRSSLSRIMRTALDDLGFVPELHTPGEDAAFIAGMLLSAEVWAAATQGETVGFIAVTKGTQIPALYVAPGWQGQGIGGALLIAARQGRETLTLHCFQQNTGARQFYERHGFAEIARDDVGKNDEGLPDITYRWSAPVEAGVDWSRGTAWMNGHLVPIADAKIGVTDWGVTRSDITYDVVSVWEGGFFRLDAHIKRFTESVAAMRLQIEQGPEEIRQICHDMVARAGLRSAYVAFVASRGAPLVPGNRDPRQCANHFFAWAVPYVYVVKPEIAEQGASLWIAKDVRRIPEDSVNPRAKNYHWGDMTAGIFEAKDHGFETVALLDHAGNVTEGPGFNVFAVKDDRVVTSDHGVLHGITRRTVLEMADEAGLATELRPLPLEEFLEADEVFLSTTGGGVVPITNVDDRVFSNGAPGPVTLGLRERYYDWRMRPEHRQDIAYSA